MADPATPSAPVTEDQHFVPRFHLRRFAGARNELQILDGKLGKLIRPRGPKGICRERFFYAVETGKHDAVSQEVEAHFKRVESEVAVRSERVITALRDGKQIDEDCKYELAYLMSMIWVRGPEMRAQVDRMQGELMKGVLRIVSDLPGLERRFDQVDAEMGRRSTPELRESARQSMASGDYKVSFNNVEHLRMLESVPNSANLFHSQYWRVYVNKTAESFVTTDNPVVADMPPTKGFFPPTFRRRTHYLALSPDLCVQALYPDHDTGKKLRRTLLLPGHEWAAAAFNRVLASQAHRYVFARDRRPLETILSKLVGRGL